MDYKKTSVDWANFMRDMCRKFVDGLYYDGNEMFSGEVEIDESLFGRRCKYHKGDHRGQKVWILGIVEGSSHRITLYPFNSRDEDTLMLSNATLPREQRYTLTGGGCISP